MESILEAARIVADIAAVLLVGHKLYRTNSQQRQTVTSGAPNPVTSQERTEIMKNPLSRADLSIDSGLQGRQLNNPLFTSTNLLELILEPETSRGAEEGEELALLGGWNAHTAGQPTIAFEDRRLLRGSRAFVGCPFRWVRPKTRLRSCQAMPTHVYTPGFSGQRGDLLTAPEA